MGLVRMYSGCGRIMEARLVFDKMSHRDVVTWSIMIDGYETNVVALHLLVMVNSVKFI